ncbi:aminodeoxychorismate lyase [Bacillus sp. DJP31]|uniref:aminodeoxychorismate lyase n=1 Tax=Bacillus sp. DJP31 TaxID=3409789 RepID=UPI003BB7256C
MYIYLNGQIIKEEEAVISVFDHGFMYGLGLFETFRVYQGHPFLLVDHLHRLRKGLTELQIQWDVTNEQVVDAIQQILHKNKLQDAYIRLNVSAGPSGLGLITEPYKDSTTIIYVKQIPEMVKEKKGVFLKIRRNTPEGSYRLKSHHYLNNILGKQEIGQNTELEGIFLTKEGFVAEGIVSNLFWVKDRIVYTPHIETGILNGITRQFVLKLLEEAKITYKEGFFSLDDLLSSDEAFITNSIQEIIPLYKIEHKLFPKSERHITRWLQKKYNELKHIL